MTTQLWIQIIAYAVSIGCLYGAISTRLKVLEKKVDIHNHLVDRMYKAETKIALLEEEIYHAKQI